MIEQKWQKGKPVTVCLPRCSIPIPAVSRSLWLGFHPSDSAGYRFRSKPAPQRPRIPPALGMLVKHPGWRLILLWGGTKGATDTRW
ncbi:hypothetical protein [endosymbiont of unidentified scaly snail isolate Monju]|uniref:hypothetical protein n=1 Tax=endosymbiont of unidentified scaly snail isolate Monju TaxID=1248727 RepID=UPI0011DD46ED|nr:hypothetical protein [endosymbiont of unidentified scaly snail isolate Monju]